MRAVGTYLRRYDTVTIRDAITQPHFPFSSDAKARRIICSDAINKIMFYYFCVMRAIGITPGLRYIRNTRAWHCIIIVRAYFADCRPLRICENVTFRSRGVIYTTYRLFIDFKSTFLGFAFCASWCSYTIFVYTRIVILRAGKCERVKFHRRPDREAVSNGAFGGLNPSYWIGI